MGFNISGLVISKNYQNNFEQLQEELGWNLVKEDEINFETASSNWKDNDVCDVYFSDKGTLLFIGMDRCVESWALKDANTLTFALSETSMAFNLNYCENGVLKRSIMEVEDNRITEEGDKLDVEAKSTDTSEIIWNQIDVVLGKEFGAIDLNEKAIRYRFVEKKAPTAKPEPKQKVSEKEPVKSTNDKSNKMVRIPKNVDLSAYLKDREGNQKLIDQVIADRKIIIASFAIIVIGVVLMILSFFIDLNKFIGIGTLLIGYIIFKLNIKRANQNLDSVKKKGLLK